MRWDIAKKNKGKKKHYSIHIKDYQYIQTDAYIHTQAYTHTNIYV